MERVSDNAILTDHRSSRIRLRTITLWRWVAIFGQAAAIALAIHVFGMDLDVGLCSLAIGLSVVANLIAIFVYPESLRLSEGELRAMLALDIVQLAALLYLTGGLNNPFAMLILAPVTVCATTLSARSVIVTGGLAISLMTLVAVYHRPLVTNAGVEIGLPDLLVFGFWLAIVVGVVFLGVYAHSVASEVNKMSRALLATQMALGREQKMTDLAGVVAAMAHELGTPLATIKLASRELSDDLAERPELQQDAQLIANQADRCHQILKSMGRTGKDDRQIAQVPFSALVEEAAEPHLDRDIAVLIEMDEAHRDEPLVRRQPELIHGLRNLIQNAVDFAQSAVWIDLSWSADRVTFRVVDDGSGFPAQIIGRIGDPFMRRRHSARSGPQRQGYEGMGLGLFIAKNLLERTGAEITFANTRDPFEGKGQAGERSGAIVEVSWPRSEIETGSGTTRPALGDNPLIDRG